MAPGSAPLSLPVRVARSLRRAWIRLRRGFLRTDGFLLLVFAGAAVALAALARTVPEWFPPSSLALIVLVLSGQGTNFQTFFFIMSAVILAFTASVITWQNQIAFKYAQASNIIPVAQVPIQICPVLVYFFIFALTAPHTISVFLILTGTILTIVAGFLLGRRGSRRGLFVSASVNTRYFSNCRAI